MPFKALYGIADFIYLIIYYIVRYRRSVVKKNLTAAFPEKSDSERRTIERRFYHWLCDYFVETIKLLTITPEEMHKHIEYRGFEKVEDAYDRGQHCAALLGHYCNWEWLSATKIFQERHPEAIAGLIYHPLRQDSMDKVFIALRSHLGGTCIPKKEILRYLVRYRKEERMTLFGYIADQSPKWENIHLWLPFMNQDTPVFTGAERIIRKMNNAVFYVDMQRPERGKYIATFIPMTTDPASLPENAVTEDFFRRLEETIHRQPEFYLWTHNRWKRQRTTATS